MNSLPKDQTDFSDTTFRELEYPESQLKGLSFVNCKFLNCNFFMANFDGCVFSNCVFEKCDFSVMKINKTEFLRCSFKKSKLVGVDWTEKFRYKLYIKFDNCILNLSTFANTELKEFEAKDCVAHEVGFEDTSMIKAICTNTDFSGSIFLHTNLSEADFKRAKNYIINPGNNNIRKAKFSLPDALNLLAPFEVVLEPYE